MDSLRKILSFCVTFALLQVCAHASFATTNSIEGETSYVNDEANVLTKEQRFELAEKLSEHNSKGPGKITVFIITKLPPKTTIEKYALAKIKDRTFSPRENFDRILLVVAIEDGRMKIETAEGIWSVLSDEDCQQIIDDFIIPQFNQSNYSAGIRNGVIALIDKLEQSRNSDQLIQDQRPISNRYGVQFLSFDYQPRVHFWGVSLPLISGNGVSEKFSGIDAGLFLSGCSTFGYDRKRHSLKFENKTSDFNGISISGAITSARFFNGFSVGGLSYFYSVKGISIDWLGVMTKKTSGFTFGTLLSGSHDFQGVSTSLIFSGADYFQGFSIAGLSYADVELDGISLNWFGVMTKKTSGLTFGTLLSGSSDFQGVSASAVLSGADYFEGISIAGVSYSKDFKGISLNWLGVATVKASGFTFGTIFSGADDYFQGVSSAFILSGSDYFTGVSVSSINWGNKEFTGCEIGIFNYAKKLEGVQIGLINIARDALIPYTIGINLNFKKKPTKN